MGVTALPFWGVWCWLPPLAFTFNACCWLLLLLCVPLAVGCWCGRLWLVVLFLIAVGCWLLVAGSSCHFGFDVAGWKCAGITEESLRRQRWCGGQHSACAADYSLTQPQYVHLVSVPTIPDTYQHTPNSWTPENQPLANQGTAIEVTCEEYHGHPFENSLVWSQLPHTANISDALICVELLECGEFLFKWFCPWVPNCGLGDRQSYASALLVSLMGIQSTNRKCKNTLGDSTFLFDDVASTHILHRGHHS